MTTRITSCKTAFSAALRCRFLLNCLACFGVGIGTLAVGHETDKRLDAAPIESHSAHAFFEPDPFNNRVDEILQVGAVLPQGVTVPWIHGVDASDSGDASPDSPVGAAPIRTLVQVQDGQVQDGVDETLGSNRLAPPVAPALAEPFGTPLERPSHRLADGRRSRLALGAVAGAYAAAPEMIGDFFGGSFLLVPSNEENPSFVSLAGGDRRFKVAENVSPIPQHRVFLNFNHFENALIDADGETRSLDRYALGFEQTFAEGMASFEMRLPLVDGLNSKQFSKSTDTTANELGNLAMAVKIVLLSGETWLISGGSSMTVPTGDDFETFGFGDSGPHTRLLVIENDAVHMAPFLGLLIQPNRRWFGQAFVQADFDLNGNEVSSEFNFEGVLQDQNLLFIDASLGRWIFRDRNTTRRLTGIGVITELHYTSTLNDSDSVFGITNPFNRMDILNAASALHFEFHQTSIRIGGAAPLRDDEESLYDAEVIFQLNRRF